MDLGTSTAPLNLSLSSFNGVPATLPLWERTLQRALAAERMGQATMALAYQQRALALSLRVLQQLPPAGREDDCVAALVVSHLNVAELQAQAAETDAAARLLCRAHMILHELLSSGRHSTALRQAAWRHRREILAGLMAHVREHGLHPAITQALANARSAGFEH